MFKPILRTLLAVTVVVCAASTVSAVAAGRALVTRDGDVFRVEEVGSGKFARAIQLTIDRADGTTETKLVPGTADRAWDAFPSLALDPDTGLPALVWSRHNGVDFDLVLSLHNGKRFGAPVVLAGGPADEIQARAFTAPGEGLHVIWMQPGQRNSFHYGLYRTASGVAVRGPERVFLKKFFPGGTGIEGGTDDPGIQPGPGGSDPPDDSGAGTGDTSCASQEGFGMCAEGLTPAGSADRCGRFSVVLPMGNAQCMMTRDGSGWMRGVCAPVGTDLTAALDGLNLTCGN